MGVRYCGSTGGPHDLTAVDSGTNVCGRSPTPGPYCSSRDPSVWQRTGYVLEAWEVAKAQYAADAIIAHTEQDFYDLIRGAVPMLLLACGGVLTTTIIGAGVGSLAGGVGAIPGAAVGFAVGTALLEAFGLAFLAVYLRDRVHDIAAALYSGACTAWKSCGDRESIHAAARSMAEGVGLFYAALLQALLMYLGAALASRTLSASRNALRGSRLFQACEDLEAWITRNFTELYKKHIGKPPPGVLPPITADLADWAKYIEGIKLEPPPNRGTLWSKIGAAKAEELATQRGLVTLEMLLKDNGFLPAYEEAFPKGTWNDTTKAIWRQTSLKYARGLQGRVIAFVDDPVLAKAIQEAPVKPLKDLAVGEPAIKEPVIASELMEISDVMERNPNISVVEIRDVSKPDVTIKVMTRAQVLQSKGAPLH
jgi:hypothetical protein